LAQKLKKNSFVEEFAAALRTADIASKKRPRDPLKNSMRDALIALTAREHGMVLVTGDRNLEALATRHRIATKFIQQPLAS
jgi:predicted nucleic acid-binding protein